MKILALVGALFCATALLPAQAQVCSTTLHAAGCGGASLTITFPPIGNHHQMNLAATGLYASELVGMVWGFDAFPGGVPVLNGSACLLHPVPAWSFIQQADAQGNWSYQRAWPYNITLHFYIQVAGLHIAPNGDLELRTTNTELAECHVE